MLVFRFVLSEGAVPAGKKLSDQYPVNVNVCFKHFVKGFKDFIVYQGGGAVV